MVNGTKTIPLNSLGGATGTAATEFRWDLIMGVFNKPLSSPSVSLNLSFGRVFYIMTTNYDRKWELDLMFTAIPFRPPRVFRFSLIDITRRWNNPAGHQSTIPAISYIAKSSSIFSFEFRGKAVYTSHLSAEDAPTISIQTLKESIQSKDCFRGLLQAAEGYLMHLR